MTLKSQLSIDAAKVFLNTDEFAEEITYTPKNGSPKTIKALVVRNRIDAADQGVGRIASRQAEVYIANDAINGVTSVDKGDDEVSFPETAGGTPITWVVIDLLGMDHLGLFHLLVEK